MWHHTIKTQGLLWIFHSPGDGGSQSAHSVVQSALSFILWNHPFWRCQPLPHLPLPGGALAFFLVPPPPSSRRSWPTRLINKRFGSQPLLSALLTPGCSPPAPAYPSPLPFLFLASRGLRQLWESQKQKTSANNLLAPTSLH